MLVQNLNYVTAIAYMLWLMTFCFAGHQRTVHLELEK